MVSVNSDMILTEPIPEMMGLKGIPGLCSLCSP